MRMRTGAVARATLVLLAVVAVLAASADRPTRSEASTRRATTTVSTDVGADTTWTLAGSPYQVAAPIAVARGATLTVEPGVEVRFAADAGLSVQGRLLANGTEARRIVFTGASATPGSWRGIAIQGEVDLPAEGSTISWATVEYGGASQANVYVEHGRVAISHALVRRSEGDGLRAGAGGGGSVIEASQIVENGELAVRNDDPDAILIASNNWWGAAGGPVVEGGCNPGGSGGQISARVEFRPFLRQETSDPGLESPSSARILEMSPRRWYAPPDGVSRVYVDVTLRDGTGQVLPGRTVRLSSTLGEVVDGGVTDIQGKALAYVTSGAAGDAKLKARLDLEDGCETAESATATVTFKGSESAFPDDAEAPYMDDDIEADPMPIVRGKRTTLRARLTNPNAFPIVVDGTFAVAQLGIGLTFGPIGEVRDRVIAAGEVGVFEVPWTPGASGDQCIQFVFSTRPVGAARGAAQVGGTKQSNKSVGQGDKLDQVKKGLASAGKTTLRNLDRAARGDKMKTSSPNLIPGPQLGSIKDIISFSQKNGEQIHEAMSGNEPDGCIYSVSCNQALARRAAGARTAQGFLVDGTDYTTYATLERLTYTPLAAGTEGLSAARTQAYNALTAAWLDATAALNAAYLSQRRYAAAVDDGDLTWAAQQSAAQDYYLGLAGPALVAVADRLEALVAVEASEGVPDPAITAADVRAYQDQLRASGFSASELAAGRAIGLSDQELGYLREEILAEDASEFGGGTVRGLQAQTAAALRAFGQSLAAQGAARRASRGAQQATQLTSVNAASFQFTLRNPSAAAAVISLKTRRVDMPADWGVTVTPARPTLAAGASTTVSVVVTPGRAALQGDRARVAVEGFLNGTELIDGVVFDVVVPRVTTFGGGTSGGRKAFVPVVMRGSTP